MTEEDVRLKVREIVDRVANNDTHLASIECADELATLALAEWICFSREHEDQVGRLFKVALALGYETRRRHEGYEPLDENIWNSAFEGDFNWGEEKSD
jgi:hypothetical protein